MRSTRPTARFTAEPAREASLPVVFAAAVLVVVGAIVLFVVTNSDVLRAIVFALLVAMVFVLSAYIYRMLTSTRAAPEPGPEGRAAQPVFRLGDEVSQQRLQGAIVATLRDLLALEHGTLRFAQGALRRLDDGASSEHVGELLDRQQQEAAMAKRALTERLDAVGRGRRRSGHPQTLAQWVDDRLLSHNILTNARHAYGLTHLAATSAAILERLGGAAGDGATHHLATEIRERAEGLAAAWDGSWDSVLDACIAQGHADEPGAMQELLADAEGMERMRAALLRVAFAHGREAGFAAGAEDAGLDQLLETMEGEAHIVDDHLRLVDVRLRELSARPSRRRAWETYALTHTTEHVRAFKLARDMRDVVATAHLEAGTYNILEHAARRASDSTTGALATRLHGEAVAAANRDTAALDTALEVALLAE